MLIFTKKIVANSENIVNGKNRLISNDNLTQKNS